jgi:hypothetical protein
VKEAAIVTAGRRGRSVYCSTDPVRRRQQLANRGRLSWDRRIPARAPSPRTLVRVLLSVLEHHDLSRGVLLAALASIRTAENEATVRWILDVCRRSGKGHGRAIAL